MRKRGLVMLGGFIAFAVFLMLALFFMQEVEKGNSAFFIPLILTGGLSAVSILAVAVYNILPFFAAGWVKRVTQSGMDAKAVVLENNYLKGIGGYQGGDQWLELPVRVQPASEPAYEAKMKCKLTQIMLLHAGSEVPVRYDPTDKNKVVLIGDAISILKGMQHL
jgi:hypothetical protein